MTDLTTSPPSPTPSTTAPRILLYSDDRSVRDQVRLAVGPRIAADAPEIFWQEVATAPAVISLVDDDEWDLIVLDGEADKAGGMGVARQLKNEQYECPPILVLTGRPQDSWLASWSQADGVVSRPLDPIAVHGAVAGLL